MEHWEGDESVWCDGENGKGRERRREIFGREWERFVWWGKRKENAEGRGKMQKGEGKCKGNEDVSLEVRRERERNKSVERSEVNGSVSCDDRRRE